MHKSFPCPPQCDGEALPGGLQDNVAVCQARFVNDEKWHAFQHRCDLASSLPPTFIFVSSRFLNEITKHSLEQGMMPCGYSTPTCRMSLIGPCCISPWVFNWIVLDHVFLLLQRVVSVSSYLCWEAAWQFNERQLHFVLNWTWASHIIGAFLVPLCFVADFRLAFPNVQLALQKIHNTNTCAPTHTNPQSHTHTRSHTVHTHTRARTQARAHTHIHTVHTVYTVQMHTRINHCTLICNTLQLNVQPLIHYIYSKIYNKEAHNLWMAGASLDRIVLGWSIHRVHTVTLTHTHPFTHSCVRMHPHLHKPTGTHAHRHMHIHARTHRITHTCFI